MRTRGNPTGSRLHWIVGAIVLLLAPLASSARERWVHVRVEDNRGHDEVVRVNLPLQMIRNLLPMIETDELRSGRLRLDDHVELEGIDLRKMLAALRDAPDAEFVTVQDGDESVRVFKEAGFLKVHVDSRRNDERVRITVPLDVVDALLSGGPDELDLLAALEQLGEFDDRDLVIVESDEGRVRVWIDDDQTGGGP